jgi:hypothetical protein
MERIIRLLVGLLFALCTLISLQMDYNTGSNFMAQYSPLEWIVIIAIINIAVIITNIYLTVWSYYLKYNFWTGPSKELLISMGMWDFLFIPFLNIVNLIYIISKIIKIINKRIKDLEERRSA